MNRHFAQVVFFALTYAPTSVRRLGAYYVEQERPDEAQYAKKVEIQSPLLDHSMERHVLQRAKESA